VQFGCQVARFLGKAQVGGDDDRVSQLLVAKVIGENGKGGQRVAGDAKETLNLTGV